jgi:alcohol dehydrogenase
VSEIGVLRPPARILLGAGAASQAGRVAAEHGSRALICTDAVIAASAHLPRVVGSLERAGVGVEVLPGAVAELPLSTVEEAIGVARAYQPDVIVGLGGGSCLDLAKLIAIGLTAGLPLRQWYGEGDLPRPPLPVVAIPTTAGTGSEVTPVAVLTDPERTLKVGVASTGLVPRAAICDPELTHGAPSAVTAHAGIDALAHAIEAYCAIDRQRWDAVGDRVFVGRNALSDVFALRAIALIGGALRAAIDDEPGARAAMMEGSLCAGLAFATAGTALAHALQYPIGARTQTPHGLGIGLLLPFAMAFNAAAVPNRMRTVGRELGVGEDARAVVSAVQRLARDVGIPGSLRELGVQEAELPAIAEQALDVRRLMDNNPRPVSFEVAVEVLEQAMNGTPLELLDRKEDG